MRQIVGIQTQVAWLHPESGCLDMPQLLLPKYPLLVYFYSHLTKIVLSLKCIVFIFKKKSNCFHSGAVLILKENPVNFEGFFVPTTFSRLHFSSHKNCVAITEPL